MRGEQSVINQRVLKHSDNPIKESIGSKSPEDIIKCIEQDYWNEWRRKLNFSTTGVVYCKHLGQFHLGFSQLKGYIRSLISNIRKKRIAIKRYEKEGRWTAKKTTEGIELDLVLKLRAALSQLDEQRTLFILRTIRWNKKLRARGEDYRIKCNYEQWNFSFVNKKEDEKEF